MSRSTDLLLPLGVRVSDVGEQVVLQIGDFKRTLDFITALELAALMKREARFAKVQSGDYSMRRNVGAIIHDAATEQKRRAKKLPELLKAKQIQVRALGQSVDVYLGGTMIGIPYQAASQIAQWLRLHGKMARNAAGEHGHWSTLVRPQVLEARA